MLHDHHHHEVGYTRAFAWGIALNVAFVVVEAIFGVASNSLAMLADAGHNVSDVLGLILAWGAQYLSRIKPSERRTYGWRSSSIAAALLNSVVLLVAIGGMVWEALRRFTHPEPTAGAIVIVVAGIGVIVNSATAALFFKGRTSDLNIRAAFVHMAADVAVSLGVVLAGCGILLTGRLWIDPLVSLVIAGMILVGTWGLFRQSVDLALHAVPPGIDLQEVKSFLVALPGVERVHDLHVWAMSTTETALTAHLVKPVISNEDALLAKACQELHHRFGIHHTTLQIERDSEAAQCRQAPDDVV
jgi:cobalt-zinc-cadmium efflux system protein